MRRVTEHNARDFRESTVARRHAVGAAVVTIADFGFSAQELTNVQSCTISVHTADINFLCTGNNPGALFGIPVAVGQTAVVTGNTDINNLRMIAQGADSEVTVCFEWNLAP